MKKFFALLLSLAMVLALVACGQKDPTPDTPDTPDDPQTKVEYKVATNFFHFVVLLTSIA